MTRYSNDLNLNEDNINNNNDNDDDDNNKEDVGDDNNDNDEEETCTYENAAKKIKIDEESTKINQETIINNISEDVSEHQVKSSIQNNENFDNESISSSTTSFSNCSTSLLGGGTNLLNNRSKSRSVSNDSTILLSANYSNDSNDTNATSTSTKSTGLKLVLKRQAGDRYEIKNGGFVETHHHQLQHQPVVASIGASSPTISTIRTTISSSKTGYFKHRNTSSLVVPYSSSSSSTQSSISTRPKREAARKVKFIFSDNEYEADDSPIKKRTRKISTSSSTSSSFDIKNSNLQLTHQQHSTEITRGSYADYDNVKKQDKQIVKSQLSSSSSSSSDLGEQTLDVKREKINLYKSKPNATTTTITTSAISTDYTKEYLEPFTKSDIISTELTEKIKIINNQPLVVVDHSIPFPIALVEDKTNIVCTKALLLMHLFKSYSAPCIGCPLCKTYLTISEFSKHIHPSEDDDEEETCDEINKKKSYKILPYWLNNELKDSDIAIWKQFGKRYSYFKQLRQAKAKSLHEKKPIRQKSEDEEEQEEEEGDEHEENKQNENDKKEQSTESKTKEDKQLERKNQQRKETEEEEEEEEDETTKPEEKIKLNDWDCVNENSQIFYMSIDRLESDQVVYIEKEEITPTPSTTTTPISTRTTTNKKDENKKELDDDLLLSEEEEEDDDDEEEVEESTIAKVPSDQSAIVPESTIISSDKLKENLIKKFSSTSTSSSTSSSSSKPTLIERYIHFYDNLSKDLLLYICDNEFTIIPDSYIIYINSKRQLNFKQLRLAKSKYYQTLWLCLSLDLECKSIRGCRCI